MTTLILPPNMEALISAFLRDQPEIVDLIPDDDAGARVYTALPKSVVYPCARVTQLADTPAGSPLWSIAHSIQIEGFGGSKDDARRIADTARALIDLRLEGIHEGYGVVNGTTPGSLMDLPDEDHTPAKPRYLFTSTIYARPLATLTS